MADADRKIEAFLNKICSPVTHVDIELSTWMRSSIVDVSRFRAAPGGRLGHFPFESDRAFPAQC